MKEPRHLTGLEVAEGVRRLALEDFGILARNVLEFWGIRDTADVGRVVFAMIDEGILVGEENDDLRDYVHAFDFEDAFEINYPWAATGP